MGCSVSAHSPLDKKVEKGFCGCNNFKKEKCVCGKIICLSCMKEENNILHKHKSLCCGQTLLLGQLHRCKCGMCEIEEIRES
jgi:hypothetical protein